MLLILISSKDFYYILISVKITLRVQCTFYGHNCISLCSLPSSRIKLINKLFAAHLLFQKMAYNYK